MADPSARPERGPKGYAFPVTTDRLLAWSAVDSRLSRARRYWLVSTNPDGTPHSRPVWGVWIEQRLYFNGHPDTRWARNLAREPRALVHLESAAHVVILEGIVEDIETTDARLGAMIVEGWMTKYGRLAPDPEADGIFQLVPHRARAWSENLKDGTVWTF